MGKLCIVLTTDYSQLKDAQKKAWQAETISDLETIYKTLEDHEIIEIKVNPLIKDNNIEKTIDLQLSQEIFHNVSSCHIVINSHGSIVNKDLQDNAIKKVIERISDNFTSISQLTALVCYAMAEDNAEAARERALNQRGHTAAYETRVKTQATAIEILIKKISKMELIFPQKFSIWGPTTAYDPKKDQDLVEAMLQQKMLFTESHIPRNKSISIQIAQISIDEFMKRVANSLTWLENHAGGKEEKPLRIEKLKSKLPSEAAKLSFFKSYQHHVTFLGKILDELYKELEEKYHAKSETKTTIPLDHCHFLHEKLKTHAKTIDTKLDGLPQLKKVFRNWKQKYKANSSERLAIYHQYLGDKTEKLPSGAAEHVLTPPPSPDRNGRPTSPDSPLLAEMSMFVNICAGSKTLKALKETKFQIDS